MTITMVKNQDIFESKAKVLVNPVNCVGVMGKGLALQFKQRFPQNYKEYRKFCDRDEFKVGNLIIFGPENNKIIINFPTKVHWRDSSRYEYIELGLQKLVTYDGFKRYDIKSIAIPPLGCGLGGLDWNKVKPMIIEAFKDLPDIEVILYEP